MVSGQRFRHFKGGVYEIVGYATGNEAVQIAAPLPGGIGVAPSMQAALASAGLEAATGGP